MSPAKWPTGFLPELFINQTIDENDLETISGFFAGCPQSAGSMPARSVAIGVSFVKKLRRSLKSSDCRRFPLSMEIGRSCGDGAASVAGLLSIHQRLESIDIQHQSLPASVVPILRVKRNASLQANSTRVDANACQKGEVLNCTASNREGQVVSAR
jgi:hypothetical protein